MSQKNDALKSQIDSVADSMTDMAVPKGTPSFNNVLTAMIANFTTLGYFDFIKTILHIFVKWGASFLQVFLHYNWGYNAIGIVTVYSGFVVISILGGVMASVNNLSAFTGVYYDYSLFETYAFIYLFVGFFHVAHVQYIRYACPKKMVYSYSSGNSWLFPLWLKLVIALNINFLRTESSFQKVVEPMLFIIVGTAFRLMGYNFGTFLITSAICVFAERKIMEDVFLNELLLLNDSKLLNKQLIGHLRGDNINYSNDNGVKLGGTIVKEMKRTYSHEIIDFDAEIKKLQKEQKL